MGCWEKPDCIRDGDVKDMEKALFELSVEPPDEEVRRKVKENWDFIAKPLDGMGRFETLTAQIGAILGTDEIDISHKAVIVMCADNGIVEEGISQSGQEVTAVVAKEMGKGRSSVGKMAAAAGAKVIPVDIGINRREGIPGVFDRKVRCGTRNFRLRPAMTRAEALRAIFTGMEVVSECRKKGIGCLLSGRWESEIPPRAAQYRRRFFTVRQMRSPEGARGSVMRSCGISGRSLQRQSKSTALWMHPLSRY